MSDFLKEPLNADRDNGFLDGFKDAQEVARSYRTKMDADKGDVIHAIEQAFFRRLKQFNERYEKHG